MILRNLIFLITMFFSTAILALVDMNNASFSDTWTDMEVPGSGHQLRVLRSYKSRTLFNGMFGFGWCSEFETRLNETPEGGVKVSECGDGEEIYYSTTEVSRADKESIIKKIFENMKAAGDNPGFSADYMAVLKKKLMRDQSARESYASRYKVNIPVKAGAVLMANGREVESVTKAKTFFTRQLPDGSAQRFDLNGRLINFYNKNGDALKINFEAERIASVENDEGATLSFQYFENGKVKKITGPDGLKSEYLYNEKEDLIWTKNTVKTESLVSTFEYNEYHNMTKSTFPDKTFFMIKYDNQKDWVTGFTDRQGCTENYKYESAANDPEHHYWALTTKICDGKTVASNRYEFWHKQLPAGHTVLSRIQTITNGSLKDVVYDDVSGKPLSIKTDSEMAEYRYMPNGLLKSKTTKEKILEFSYENSLKKVSKVVEKTVAGKSSRHSAFQYDSNGNLIYAENSEGKKVRLKYDGEGRIISILENGKAPVTLKYENKFGKPSEISHKTMGTIMIVYGSNGEISSVSGSKGPLAAETIAESYNSLMSILAPATQNLY